MKELAPFFSFLLLYLYYLLERRQLREKQPMKQIVYQDYGKSYVTEVKQSRKSRVQGSGQFFLMKTSSCPSNKRLMPNPR